MKVLIVGAGIAGPTLAYWLLKAGHEVTLVEHAPALRSGGYLIDFWGAGFDVAERMGIVPELRTHGYIFTDQPDHAGPPRDEGARGRRRAVPRLTAASSRPPTELRRRSGRARRRTRSTTRIREEL